MMEIYDGHSHAKLCLISFPIHFWIDINSYRFAAKFKHSSKVPSQYHVKRPRPRRTLQKNPCCDLV